MASGPAPLDRPEAVREFVLKTLRTQEGAGSNPSGPGHPEQLRPWHTRVLGNRANVSSETIPRAGEDRRPMLFDYSVGGIPDYTHKIIRDYSRWLAQSDLAKLMIRADPSYFLQGRLYDFSANGESDGRSPGRAPITSRRPLRTTSGSNLGFRSRPARPVQPDAASTSPAQLVKWLPG